MKFPQFRNAVSAVSVALLATSISVFAQAPAKSNHTSHEASATATKVASTQTKASQAAISPDDALEMLRSGNQRFVEGKMAKRDYQKQVKETAEGQFPFATVVSCLDSRTSSELLFDQGLGDIFNARVAGNIVNEDILGSLEFASKVVGSKLIAVIGHSNCGAIKGAIDDVKLGNLTGLLEKIRPSVADAGHSKEKGSKDHALVEEVAELNVKRVMDEIRTKSPLLKEMLDKGEIKLVGGMYDLSTGKVSFYQK